MSSSSSYNNNDIGVEYNTTTHIRKTEPRFPIRLQSSFYRMRGWIVVALAYYGVFLIDYSSDFSPLHINASHQQLHRRWIKRVFGIGKGDAPHDRASLFLQLRPYETSPEPRIRGCDLSYYHTRRNDMMKKDME